jgi:hypothetical protein
MGFGMKVKEIQHQCFIANKEKNEQFEKGRWIDRLRKIQLKKNGQAISVELTSISVELRRTKTEHRRIVLARQSSQTSIARIGRRRGNVRRGGENSRDQVEVQSGEISIVRVRRELKSGLLELLVKSFL